jgi:Ca2+-binding RTX toxin-like protein
MLGGADDDTYIVDSSMDSAFEAVGEGALDRVQTSVSYTLEAESEIELLETTDKAGSTAMNLIGNEFANYIIGNAGANTLVGGMGFDIMTGNDGADAFWWNFIAETAADVAGADAVKDFVPGLDKLCVIAIDANETNGDASNDTFEFIGTNPFTEPGQINYFVGRFDTYIQLNTDGDLDPEAVICVVGQPTVDSGWFEL